MLLRNPLSGTKRFFQKTLQSVKSFFSGGYQRLPKDPPPLNPFICSANPDMNLHASFNDLDNFYRDFTKVKTTDEKKMMSAPTKQENEIYSGSFTKASPVKINQAERRNDYGKKKRIVSAGKREEELYCKGVRGGGGCLVAQKLRELEMMDVSNVDHVLDIEEVLHYYSRLTCPAYLDIVDRFFMDMYSEFLGPASISNANCSRPRLQLGKL